MTAVTATQPVAPAAGAQEGRRDAIDPVSSPTPEGHTAAAEERWAQWVERGLESDRRTRARLGGLAWLAGSVLLVALAIYITLVP